MNCNFTDSLLIFMYEIENSVTNQTKTLLISKSTVGDQRIGTKIC